MNQPDIAMCCSARSHGDGECAASECSLLCNDLLRRGGDRFLMDPGVRVGYAIPEARDLGRADRVGLRNSSWADVGASPAVDWGRLRAAQHPQVESALCSVCPAHALRPSCALVLAFLLGLCCQALSKTCILSHQALHPFVRRSSVAAFQKARTA